MAFTVFAVHYNNIQVQPLKRYTYLKDSLGNYLTINNKKYIKTKDLQLITHNSNWRQTSQNIDKYQFK